MTDDTETQPPSEQADGSSSEGISKAGITCLAVTAFMFLLALAYAFDLATPLSAAIKWSWGNPEAAGTIVFGFLFVAGFVFRSSIMAGIGAVGVLAVVVGLYAVKGWYSFLTAGVTASGVPVEAVTPLGATLVLLSAMALIGCAAFHASNAKISEKLILGALAFFIASTGFYFILDDYSTARQQSAAAEPVRVHPDHVSSLVADKCEYQDGGFVLCKIQGVK